MVGSEPYLSQILSRIGMANLPLRKGRGKELGQAGRSDSDSGTARRRRSVTMHLEDMRATNELYVVGRRAIVLDLGSLPAGVRIESRTWLAWKPLRAALPFAEEPVQLLILQCDGGSEGILQALARACADAADGVALAPLLVTAPTRFELDHDGRGSPPQDGPGILAGARAYHEAAKRAEEAERAQRTAARAAWQGDPRDDWSELADLFKK